MSTIKVDTVRPVTTDGSLTLQGDSSGSGVSGITIDSSGNVTLNGTANDLGTVTAGTLGSGVVFPAGHVIQTVYTTKNDEGSAITTSSTPSRVVDSSGNAEWSATISNLKSSSDVLVLLTFVSYFQKTSDQIGGSFHIFRDTDGAGTNLTAVYTTTTHTGQLYEFTDLDPLEVMFVSDLQNISFIDESPTNSSHTYYLGYSSLSSTSVSIQNSMPFTMVLQEIAR